MAVKLHRPGYDHAKRLIGEGQVVLDDRDAWSDHQPTAAQENAYLEEHGVAAYGRWHLGLDDSAAEDTKARYRFPYGDFTAVHRCGVLSAEVRAAQYKHVDVEVAAAHLHGMLDELRTAQPGSGERPSPG
jgi:hypothetical protein